LYTSPHHHTDIQAIIQDHPSHLVLGTLMLYMPNTLMPITQPGNTRQHQVEHSSWTCSMTSILPSSINPMSLPQNTAPTLS
jgi:hypothetical protein